MMLCQLAILDGSGVYGKIFQWAFVLAIMASTLLVFLVLLYKRRLDMDEEPKYTMLQDEDQINLHTFSDGEKDNARNSHSSRR